MKAYSKKLLENLYRTMLRIRLCEESLLEPILKSEVKCPVHLCLGQEAIAAGVCLALKETDYIFGNHRSHGHFLAKGGLMNGLLSEIYGKQTGCSKGRGGSMHVCDPKKGFLGAAPIVAGTISLALGSALASKIRRDKRVTVSFFGDGATGEGVLFECLNFASLKKLPLIFACENNFYSTHLHISSCRPQKNINEIARPFGIFTVRVNGNEVLKVYEMAKLAVQRCRQGKGPVFMEFITYRLCGHVGADDNVHGYHTDIRPSEEVARWKRKDPVTNYEKLLLKNGFLGKAQLEKIKEEVVSEVNSAYVFTKKSLFPPRNEVTKYVFKE